MAIINTPEKGSHPAMIKPSAQIAALKVRVITTPSSDADYACALDDSVATALSENSSWRTRNRRLANLTAGKLINKSKKKMAPTASAVKAAVYKELSAKSKACAVAHALHLCAALTCRYRLSSQQHLLWHHHTCGCVHGHFLLLLEYSWLELLRLSQATINGSERAKPSDFSLRAFFYGFVLS